MVTISELVVVTIDGLEFGLFLALLGVGITLVYGLGEVLNLAIGVFVVLSVIVANELVPIIGVAPAAVAGVVAVGSFALIVDRTLLTLVYRSEGEERVLLGIFVTLGLAIVLEGLLPDFFPTRVSLPVELGTVAIGNERLTVTTLVVIAVAAVLLTALFAFLGRTFVGKATRTVFQDETGAMLVGIDPRRLRTLVFVLSSIVAAIAGIIFSLGRVVSLADSFPFTAFALIVSIVGGIRSLRGAIAAGVLLGVVHSYAIQLLGQHAYLANIVLFGTAVLMILARPEVFK